MDNACDESLQICRKQGFVTGCKECGATQRMLKMPQEQSRDSITCTVGNEIVEAGIVDKRR